LEWATANASPALLFFVIRLIWICDHVLALSRDATTLLIFKISEPGLFAIEFLSLSAP
jgi:hypothetical protein